MFFMAIAEAKQPSNAAPPQGGASRAVSGKGGPRVRWQLGSIGEEGGNVIAQGRAASATEAVRDAITAAREMDFSRALRRDRQSAHPERTGLKLSPAMQRVAAQEHTNARRGAVGQKSGVGAPGASDPKSQRQPTGETADSGPAAAQPERDTAQTETRGGAGRANLQNREQAKQSSGEKDTGGQKETISNISTAQNQAGPSGQAKPDLQSTPAAVSPRSQDGTSIRRPQEQAGKEPAGQDGQAGPQKNRQGSEPEKAGLDPGVFDSYGLADFRQKQKNFEEIDKPLMEEKQRDWENAQQEARRTMSTPSYSPPTPTGEDLGGDRESAPQGSGGGGRPEAVSPPAQMGAANRALQDARSYRAQAAQSAQDYRLSDRPLRGSTAPSDSEQQLEDLAKKEQTGNLSEQEKEQLNNLRSSNQMERQAALAKEATQARNVLGQYHTRKFSDKKMLRISERGRGLARRLGEAGQEANWPFMLVLVISVINDVFDILDVNLLFGLDQMFDVFSLVVMLGARLFIRQGSGWVASKVAAFLVEWVPFVGILPCWTIAAVYVWRRAVILRRRRQVKQQAQLRAQQEA